MSRWVIWFIFVHFMFPQSDDMYGIPGRQGEAEFPREEGVGEYGRAGGTCLPKRAALSIAVGMR